MIYSHALAEAKLRHGAAPGARERIRDFLAGWRGTRGGRDHDSFGDGRRSRQRRRR